MLSARRLVLIALVAAACLVLGVFAATSLRRVGQAVTTQSQPCSPQPCAAPQGFEADLSEISSTNGLLVIQVRFKNRTRADAFEAVSYRHTSPTDFQFRSSDGHQIGASFSSECPDWGELRIERGASAGPEPLCFRASSLKGSQLIWSPDLGLLFDDVQISLG